MKDASLNDLSDYEATPPERFKGLAIALQRASGTVADLGAALARRRPAGDPRIRPVEPTARQLRRQRSRDVAATSKKNRHTDFLRARLQADAERHLLTWARIYFEHGGNDEMRRNVIKAVHRQARLYSQANDEPFETSLKRVEGAMLNALSKAA